MNFSCYTEDKLLTIRKMIMRYLLLSLRKLCHVLSRELNNLHFKKDSEFLSWGWNQEAMVKLISREKQQRKVPPVYYVYHTCLGEQIYKANYFHRQTSMHILPWQHKGHSVPDMFSCQPLVDFLNKKKASSSLAESGLSGTWHNEIWHRVWLSHTVHTSDRRFLGLLIWTLTPLELSYHNTSWQPEERLFFLSFQHASLEHTHEKNVYLNLSIKTWT